MRKPAITMTAMTTYQVALMSPRERLSALLFGGDQAPLGALHDHRGVPFLALRCCRPAFRYHRQPVGRIERVRGRSILPEIDADERPAVGRDPIIFADQARYARVSLRRPIDGVDDA